MATAWRTTRLYPRLALSILLSAGLVAGTALPGYAQPGNDQVPDPGARPAPAGQVPLPDGSFARPPTGSENLVGPLAAEIAEVQIKISTRTAERQAIEPQLGPAEQELTQAEQAWRTASQERLDAQAAMDELVGDSYRGAAALPPDLFIPELRGLSAHTPVLPVEAPIGAEAKARELVEARAAERESASRFDTAEVTERDLAQRHRVLTAELADLAAELAALEDRNAAMLAEAERARDRAAQELDFPVTEPVAGFRAGEAAVAAVNFALDQLGKPYLWGAEGPDRFDCSGLVFASYNHARTRFGVAAVPTLARVAADQYQSTRTRVVAHDAALARRGLLPGDLVFFASGLSWQTIHHVGIYVGNGYMVHAPNRNEVVKVSPVWWSRFFAATRVVDAVQVGDPTTPDPRPTTPGPRPTTPGPQPTTPRPSPTPTGTTVPDLLSDPTTAQEAEAAITAARLRPVQGSSITAITNDCTANDVHNVVRQQPDPGTRVRIDTTVTYQICEPKVTVPNLLEDAMTVSDAEQAVRDAGLVPQVKHVSSSAPVDEVIRTVPAGGTEVLAGSTVVIEVSLGDLAPNVEKLPCEEAIELLELHGLKIAYDDESPTGEVQGQEPQPEEELGPDRVVTLTGCAEPPESTGERVAFPVGAARFDTLLLAGSTSMIAV